MIDKDELIAALIEAAGKDLYKEIPMWGIEAIRKQSEHNEIKFLVDEKMFEEAAKRFNNECFVNSLPTKYDKLKNDFELVCKLYDDVLEKFDNQKNKMKKLEEENEKLKRKVHSYYMAMCAGKE